MQSYQNWRKKMSKEAWKDIKGYEGYYKVSNFGDVLSLWRVVGNSGCKNSNLMSVNGGVLKKNLDSHGYYIVNLSKAKTRKTVKVHLLVWDAFGNRPRDGRKLQVDHIDNNKLNNRIDNLQLLSNRDNCIKSKASKPKTSKFTGVHYNMGKKKWQSTIQINGETKHLGYFDQEIKAYEAYMSEKERIAV